MELYHGRRGSLVCGMTRGNQTLLLMLAMVVSMAFVLVWEAVPFARSGGSLTPILAEPGSRDHEELELSIQSFEAHPLSKSPLLDVTEKGTMSDVDDEKSKGDDRSVNHDRLGSGSASEAGPSVAPSQSDDQITKDVPGVAKEQDTDPNFQESFMEVPADHERPSARDINEASFNETENKTEAAANAFETVAVSLETLQRSNREPTTRIPESTEKSSGDEDDKLNPTTQAEEKNLTDEAEHPSAGTLTAEETDGVTQFSNETVGSSGDGEVEDSKSCDYTIGDWVLDKTRPLYSGKECALWLSPDWACRRHNHPDKNMDRYRWQPRGCDLPVFNASVALETLRNKVVAFVGDSLGRQQYQSLLCMLTRGKNYSLTDVGSMFKFYTPRGARKPTGYAHRFDSTNTTIVFRWTVTLARAQQMADSNVALHLDKPEEFLEKHLGKIDVLVVNSGHHWNRGKMQQNRFRFYNHGEAVPDEGVSVAYNRTVHNVVRWLHLNMQKRKQVIYYRSLSPRHFRNGDWSTGGTCERIRYEEGKQVQEGIRVDVNAESAVAGTTVKLLNVTSLSLLQEETHVSKYGGVKGGQDCLHWCLPGVPDTWNEIMLAELGGNLTSRREN